MQGDVIFNMFLIMFISMKITQIYSLFTLHCIHKYKQKPSIMNRTNEIQFLKIVKNKLINTNHTHTHKIYRIIQNECDFLIFSVTKYVTQKPNIPCMKKKRIKLECVKFKN